MPHKANLAARSRLSSARPSMLMICAKLKHLIFNNSKCVDNDVPFQPRAVYAKAGNFSSSPGRLPVVQQRLETLLEILSFQSYSTNAKCLSLHYFLELFCQSQSFISGSCMDVNSVRNQIYLKFIYLDLPTDAYPES